MTLKNGDVCVFIGDSHLESALVMINIPWSIEHSDKISYVEYVHPKGNIEGFFCVNAALIKLKDLTLFEKAMYNV